MFVLLFADAIKLQVDAMLSGRLRSFAELNVFGEANAVCRRENSVKPDLLRVSDGIEVVRRKSRFTAGEENDYLASWLEQNRSIENRLGVFKRRLMNVTNLIRIHETR